MAEFEDIRLTTAKVSEFIEAYDFEVYDIVAAIEWTRTLRPIMILSIVLYLAGIYFGQKWMKNRPAYKLNTALFFWNVGLSIFSIVVTIRAFPELGYLLRQPDGLYLAVCSPMVHNYATSFWGLMFLFSKFVEFGDTAFIVLRKQKLIVLHWFHHIATLMICWVAYEYYDAMGRFFVFNAFVHSIMYPYYALRALKYRIPRKLAMAITTLQILQMLAYLYVNGYSVYKMSQGLPCTRHRNIIYTVAFVAGSFALLFVNFFVRTYFMRVKKPKTQ